VLRAGNPLSPVAAGTFSRLVKALRVATDGPYLYVAADDAGVTVANISPDDMDLDAMPDAWEQQIVDANPGDAILAIADVLPNADYDGDGLSNYSEWIAGTSPVDSLSFFAMAASPTPNSPVVVRWYSVTGKTYDVYRSSNIMNGFTLLQGGIAGDPPVNSYTDSVSGVTAFYMVEVH
jgi:hypothetical protein